MTCSMKEHLVGSKRLDSLAVANTRRQRNAWNHTGRTNSDNASAPTAKTWFVRPKHGRVSIDERTALNWFNPCNCVWSGQRIIRAVCGAAHAKCPPDTFFFALALAMDRYSVNHITCGRMVCLEG